MIDIIQYQTYGYLEGSSTTIYDVYFNLQKYKKDIKLNIISDNVGSMYRILKENNLLELISCITKQKNYYTDVTICLYSLCFQKPINITTKKLIILGTLESFIYPFNESLIPETWKYDEVIFLNNLPCFSGPVYYHKFSTHRLDNLTARSIKDSYNYCRLNKSHIFHNGIYFENIGKLIFEYCYYDRPVYYDSGGMFIHDGLYYYLSLFDINAYNSQEIKISKQEIIDKLVMKEDDMLLDML